MSFATSLLPSEVRDVVRVASTRVKNGFTKSWLFQDEKGTWEKEARVLLLDEAVHQRAIATGITTDAELRDAVSDQLAFLALSAVLNHAKKKA